MKKLKISLLIGLQSYGFLLTTFGYYASSFGELKDFLSYVSFYGNLPVMLINAFFYYPLESIKMSYLHPIVFTFANLIIWIPVSLWINGLIEDYQEKKKAAQSEQ